MSKFLEWGDTFIRKSRIYRIDLESDESWSECNFIKVEDFSEVNLHTVINWYRSDWESRYSDSELSECKAKMQVVFDIIRPLEKQCKEAYRGFIQKLEDASKLPNGKLKTISGYRDYVWCSSTIQRYILNNIISNNKTDEALSKEYIEKDFPEYLDEFKRLRDYFKQNILAINRAIGDFSVSSQDLRLRWRVVFYAEEPGVEDRNQMYTGFWGSYKEALREWRELAETL